MSNKPQDDDSNLDIATPDDFLVTRDEDDELQPVTQPLPGVEQSVRVIPMSTGDANKWGDTNGRLDPNSLDSGAIAEILNEHWFDLREADRSVTATDVEENLIAFGRDSLLKAIFRASGFDMQDALNKENLELLNDVDPGNLQKMMELSDEV